MTTSDTTDRNPLIPDAPVAIKAPNSPADRE